MAPYYVNTLLKPTKTATLSDIVKIAETETLPSFRKWKQNWPKFISPQKKVVKKWWSLFFSSLQAWYGVDVWLVICRMVKKSLLEEERSYTKLKQTLLKKKWNESNFAKSCQIDKAGRSLSEIAHFNYFCKTIDVLLSFKFSFLFSLSAQFWLVSYLDILFIINL